MTGPLPAETFSIAGVELSFLHGRDLADPNFFESAPVEVLLDAAVFADRVRDSIVRGPPGFPIVMDSIFGCLLFGQCPGVDATPVVHATMGQLSLEDLVERFWTLESCDPVSAHVTNDEGLWLNAISWRLIGMPLMDGLLCDFLFELGCLGRTLGCRVPRLCAVSRICGPGGSHRSIGPLWTSTPR